MDCGQSNSISQLMRHVTEDQRFQESIGDPRTSIVGSNQSDLTLPQSFRMNDLMREIGHIEPQKMPSSSSSYFPVQILQSVSVEWMTKYQDEVQETFQPKIQQTWDVPNASNYGNEPNYFPAEGFSGVKGLEGLKAWPPWISDSQNLMNNQNQHRLTNFESESRESRISLADLEGTVTIKNVDELKNLKQIEESVTCPKEIQDDQLPERNSNDVITKKKRTIIPEFSNARHFNRIVNEYIDDCRKKDGNPHYLKTNNITSKSILNPKAYSHIENNPMREELDPSRKGDEALQNNCYFKAELYFDEAVRRNFPDWLTLAYALHMNNKGDKAISAINHYLRDMPNCSSGALVQHVIYESYNCKYQACQSLFNWLKRSITYQHLIPAGFSMDDKDTTELDDETLNSVKSIFLKAARENPIKIDADLQIMIGYLYSLSKDYDKVVDCKLAVINSESGSSSYEMRNLGYMLFYDEKPYEALDYFFQATENPNCGALAYEHIGFVYMYLKNFREAIRYFKKLLDPDGLDDETKFQLQGDTLEDEYDLCLRLYCAIENR